MENKIKQFIIDIEIIGSEINPLEFKLTLQEFMEKSEKFENALQTIGTITNAKAISNIIGIPWNCLIDWNSFLKYYEKELVCLINTFKNKYPNNFKEGLNQNDKTKSYTI